MNWNLVEGFDLRNVNNLPILGKSVLMVFEKQRKSMGEPVAQVVSIGALWQPGLDFNGSANPIFAEALDFSGEPCVQMGYQLRAWCHLPSFPDPLAVKFKLSK